MDFFGEADEPDQEPIPLQAGEFHLAGQLTVGTHRVMDGVFVHVSACQRTDRVYVEATNSKARAREILRQLNGEN